MLAERSLVITHDKLFTNRVTRSVLGNTKHSPLLLCAWSSQARAVMKDRASHFLARTEYNQVSKWQLMT